MIVFAICLAIITFVSSVQINGGLYRASRLVIAQSNLGDSISLPPTETSTLLPGTTVSAADYVFTPPEVTTEIYVGSIVAVIPIIWASFEFASRIRTQQNCLACKGTGLVYSTRSGTQLLRPRKCWSCGGFLPWIGWRAFFLSSFFDVGNGGVLQRPAKDYDDINERIRQRELKDESKD